MESNVNKDYESVEIIDFLIFKLNKKMDGYVLTGMSKCHESYYKSYQEIDFNIPEMYEGKPIVEIADKAFSQYYKDSSESSRCHFKRNLIIPNTIKKIGKNAFLGVQFTGSLFLGDCLEVIGASAFEDAFKCENGSLIIPNSVKKIGRSSFRGCTGFSKLILGTGIKEISDFAFAEAKDKMQCERDHMNFTGAIFIPDNIRKIGVNVFNGCKNISYMSMPGNLDLETKENRGSFSFFSYLEKQNVYCAKNIDYFQDSSQVEQTIYYYLKKVFPGAINGYKPNWLKFPKTFSQYKSGDENSGFELDIYIPSIKVAIEYDSIKYHSEDRQIENDKIKNYLCLISDVRLIRVIESKHKEMYRDGNNIYYKVGSKKRLKAVINEILQMLITETNLSTMPDIDFNKDEEEINKCIDKNYRENRSLASKFPEIIKYWDIQNRNTPDEVEISSNEFKIYLLKCPTCGRKIFINLWRLHEFSAFDIILNNKCNSCSNEVEKSQYKYVKKFYNKELISDFEIRIVENYLHRVVLLEMGNAQKKNERFLMYKKIDTLKEESIDTLKQLINKYINDNSFIENKIETYRKFIDE